MDFVESLKIKAKKNLKRIVLPEWEDVRILRAASLIARDALAIPVLTGDRGAILHELNCHDLDTHGIEVIDFSVHKEKSFNLLKEKYAKKKLSDRKLASLLDYKIHQGALLLEQGVVDGMVAGINSATADVVRTSLRIIGLDGKYKTASSFFIMVMPKNAQTSDERSDDKHDPVLIFADCAIVVEPDSQQLTDICLAAVENSSSFLSSSPVVAMLSFSTEGSAHHPKVDLVVQATENIKSIKPELAILGEVQFDAALVEEVAKIKLKKQTFSKPANIFIFPDLNSANIGYKICHRLGKAQAIGPIMQGFRLPVNDLSRGASVDDIVHLVALTSLQCK